MYDGLVNDLTMLNLMEDYYYVYDLYVFDYVNLSFSFYLQYLLKEYWIS